MTPDIYLRSSRSPCHDNRIRPPIIITIVILLILHLPLNLLILFLQLRCVILSVSIEKKQKHFCCMFTKLALYIVVIRRCLWYSYNREIYIWFHKMCMFSNMNKPKQRKNEQRRSESDFFVFVSLPAIKKTNYKIKLNYRVFRKYLYLCKKKKTQNGHKRLNWPFRLAGMQSPEERSLQDHNESNVPYVLAQNKLTEWGPSDGTTLLRCQRWFIYTMIWEQRTK